MEKGLHVYCEKEMANNLEDAKAIVLGQRKTGKIVQIGHQRRSNPRYQHAVKNLMHDGKLLGNIQHAYAQWNRSKSDDLGWPKKRKCLRKSSKNTATKICRPSAIGVGIKLMAAVRL